MVAIHLVVALWLSVNEQRRQEVCLFSRAAVNCAVGRLKCNKTLKSIKHRISADECAQTCKYIFTGMYIYTYVRMCECVCSRAAAAGIPRHKSHNYSAITRTCWMHHWKLFSWVVACNCMHIYICICINKWVHKYTLLCIIQSVRCSIMCLLLWRYCKLLWQRMVNNE